MYLRHSKVKKNGKTHSYWRLVKSERVGSKVRQVTVAQLGELNAEGRAKAKELAEHFLGHDAEQRKLFEDTEKRGPLKVLLDKVRVERGRSFGDVWLAWQLWKALGLDCFCEAKLEAGREKVPWPEVAAILALAPLCEPSSELHIAEDWYRRTALKDILGVAPDLVHHTRLYRGLDRLLPHKAALESHLRQRYGELFALDFDLLLYDVTSTYFEGDAARIVEGLESLKRRLERARKPADRTQVERQIGRLLERNRRAAAKYRISVEEDSQRASGVRLVWSVNEAWSDWAELTEGT